MDKKETVILYRGQIESLLSLSSAKDIKTILRAIVSYSMDGVEPEIPEHLTFGWLWFKHTIDQHKANYTEVVSKRRDAANKRWEMQNSADDAKACKSMQVHKCDAKAWDNDNDIIKSEYIRACASDAERIASLYPKAKVGNFRQLVEAIINAISRELDRPGITPEQAVGKVESGTIKYATAVKQWPNKNKKYISDPVKFYDSGMYNHDPATWEPDESNKKQKEQKDDSSYEYVSKLR